MPYLEYQDFDIYFVFHRKAVVEIAEIVRYNVIVSY